MTRQTHWTVPRGVGWTQAADDRGRTIVYVAPLPNGPVSVLPDQSAVIWLAAVEGGGDVVDTVADVLGHDADDVRDDIEAFVAELVERGLLRRA